MLSRILVSSTLLASVAAAAMTAQNGFPASPMTAPPPPSATAAAPAPVTPAYDPIRAVIAEWNRLRQSDSFAFAD